MGTGANQFSVNTKSLTLQTNGTLMFNSAVSADTVSIITAAPATVAGTGVISANSLSLNGPSTSVVLNTNVGSVSVNGSGNATIHQAGSIQLAGGSWTGGTLVLDTTGGTGDISTTGTLTGAGSINLNSGGNIGINSSVTADGGITLTVSGTGTIGGTGSLSTAGQLSLNSATPINISADADSLAVNTSSSLTYSSSSSGTLTVNNITASSVNITADVLAYGTGNITSNQVTLTASSGAIGNSLTPLHLATAAGALNLSTSATTQTWLDSAATVNLGSLSTTDYHLSAPSVTTSGDITISGAFDVSTPSFTTVNNISAGGISIDNPNGSLTLSGSGGTLTATSGVIDFTVPSATNNNITFTGDLTMNSVTNINAPKGSVIVDTASVVGADLVSLTALSFQQVNGGTLNGNPLVFTSPTGAGTICNSNGDVVLPSTLVFAGQNLAILASGNITAPATLTTINLSSTTGVGGSLTMIAGYDFTPTTSGQLGPVGNTAAYTITGRSSDGGSILLPGVSINTSSTAAAKGGGSVLAVAHAGALNSGSIFLNAIKTSATGAGGLGGQLTMFGEGGIQVGAVDTHGSVGGNVNLQAVAPVVPPGQVVIANGTTNGTGNLISAGAGNGGAILAGSTINTSSTAGKAGDVTLNAASNITVKTGITATGNINDPSGIAGGEVMLTSAGGAVSVGTAGIVTSALSTTASPTGGNAGNIIISAPESISVSGKLAAVGGAGVGTTAASATGGAGGAIQLQTSTMGANNWVGSISITGVVDAHGGAGIVTKGGDGGAGGLVELRAGAVKVAGTGISINAAGGTGVATGAAGSVTIETAATQQLTANFDLSSTATTANIAATPGGMFTVGISAPVNGVAGTINAGTVVNKASVAFAGQGAGLIFASNGPFNPANSNVLIVVHGPANDQTSINGGATQVSVANPLTGVRTLVTPAVSVALYQVTRTGSQGIILNNNVAAANSIVDVVREVDLPAKFTGFKLPAMMTLNVHGSRPVVTLPGTELIAGQVNFDNNSNALMDFTTAVTLVAAGGQINAGTGSTLLIGGTGSTWNVNGAINSPGGIALTRTTTAAMTLNLATSGSLTGNLLLSPDFDAGITMTFKANKNDLPAVNFTQLYLPTVYQPERRRRSNCHPPQLERQRRNVL